MGEVVGPHGGPLGPGLEVDGHGELAAGQVTTTFVDDHLAELVSPAAPTDVDRLASGSADGTIEVVAPLTGTVGHVSAEVGEVVAAGQLLIVLEAMKMEHEVVAPASGRVQRMLAVPGATVHNTTRLRTVMGRTFNRMVRVLTRLEVHDSQCGYKAFRGGAARVVFSLSDVDGFAFDPEVLMIARALGLTVTEVPVDWTAVDGSSVRPMRDSFVTGVTLVRVVWRVRPARIRDRARVLGWDPAPSAAKP